MSNELVFKPAVVKAAVFEAAISNYCTDTLLIIVTNKNILLVFISFQSLEY